MVENENTFEKIPYKSAKLNSKGGDLNQEWYIEFWAWSKSENKLKRKRLTSINKYKTLKEREHYAGLLIKEVNSLLEGGYYFDKLKSEKVKAAEELNKVVKHIPVNEYFDRAIDDNKNKYNGRSYNDKKCDVNFFNKWIKKNKLNYLSVEDLGPQHCINYQKYLIKKGYAGKTINGKIGTIKTLCNEGVMAGNLKDNPFRFVKRCKEVKTSQNMAFSDEQIIKLKKLLSEKHPEMWLYCMMMFYCFLRPNEIRQLKLKHVNLIGNKITIPAEVSKNKKSNIVDVPKPLAELLKRYIGGVVEKEFYLFTRVGVPGLKAYGRNSVRDKYKRIIKPLKLDKEYSLYSWKHTGVVKAYKAGIDIKALQIQGRWHSIDMMDNYLKSLGLIENTAFTSIMNEMEL